ncbi:MULTISPECIES: hypothetical protein [Roseomonadaceae]|uniref:Uncharacterized protein n=1 Tax=Falsiroseomonas oleicola TaxID=2801474 RepID=A0ABS6H5U3_9PROT|nr:hypothetical protein [Roseomonas oleicola]MBU8543824.1 hypothetical protein [Roseomonas oleicola]
MPAEEDATIRRSLGIVPRPATPHVEWGSPAPAPAVQRRRAAWPVLGVAGLAGVAGIAAGWWWVQRDGAAPAVPAPIVMIAPPSPPDPVPQPVPPPAPAPPAAFGLPAGPPAPEPVPETPRLAALPPLMEEPAIRDHRADRPVLLRLATNPAIFLIDYPTMEAQGAALNRVAALVEKAGLPRDRVLNEAEMAEAIARAGDTPATFYFGHNYRGTDLARFFQLAERDGLALSPAEDWLHAQFRLARGLVPPGQEIVLLSLAAPGERMDAAGRATILHHELSHGRFGTDPAYAAHVRRVWHDRFTEAERAAFRHFLGREGYDTGIEELVIDEAQAYLLHTPDPRFFTPAHLGLDAAEVERLRGLMRDGMP